MSDDVFDDPAIIDVDVLYRKVPPAGDMVVYDDDGVTLLPTPAIFQWKKGEGVSVHLDSILRLRGRDPRTLYDADCASLSFPVGAARSCGDGVARTLAVDDVDPDRVAAHAEIRRSADNDNRVHWGLTRKAILKQCCWVVTPGKVGLLPG